VCFTDKENKAVACDGFQTSTYGYPNGGKLKVALRAFTNILKRESYTKNF